VSRDVDFLEIMKILVVTEYFYPEEFIINDLAAYWVSTGIQVDALTQIPSYPFGKVFKGYRNRFFSVDSWNGINIFRVFAVTGYRESIIYKLLKYLSFAITGTLVAILKAKRYDRIFVFQPGPLTLALPAIIAGWLYNIPVVIWTQDVWPDSVYAYGFRRRKLFSWFLDALVSFIYSHCEMVFVSCEGFRKKISPYSKEKPIYYFPNWPSVTSRPDGATNPQCLSNKFNFTFAGNIGKVQNLENVLRGFALASAENKNIQLNIIGDGSHLDFLRKMAEDGKISSVVFWGRKSLEEMPEYFHGSDVLLISLENKPVFNLTVPSKFQAYLAFGKPIFAVINGEVRELVEHNQIGITADPDDAISIKEGFLRFYNSQADSLNMFSSNAVSLKKKSYDREAILKSMTALIAEGR